MHLAEVVFCCNKWDCGLPGGVIDTSIIVPYKRDPRYVIECSAENVNKWGVFFFSTAISESTVLQKKKNKGTNINSRMRWELSSFLVE